MKKRRYVLELALIVGGIAVVAAAYFRSPQPPSSPEPLVDVTALVGSYRDGNFEECLRLSRQAHIDDPRDLTAVRYEGLSLWRLGETEKALDVLHRGLGMGRGNILNVHQRERLHIEIGHIMLGEGRFQEAQIEGRAALGIEIENPTNALLGAGMASSHDEIMELMALSDYGLGRTDEARSELETADTMEKTQLNLRGRSSKHLQMLRGVAPGKLFGPECEDWCPMCHPKPRP